MERWPAGYPGQPPPEAQAGRPPPQAFPPWAPPQMGAGPQWGPPRPWPGPTQASFIPYEAAQGPPQTSGYPWAGPPRAPELDPRVWQHRYWPASYEEAQGCLPPPGYPPGLKPPAAPSGPLQGWPPSVPDARGYQWPGRAAYAPSGPPVYPPQPYQAPPGPSLAYPPWGGRWQPVPCFAQPARDPRSSQTSSHGMDYRPPFYAPPVSSPTEQQKGNTPCAKEVTSPGEAKAVAQRCQRASSLSDSANTTTFISGQPAGLPCTYFGIPVQKSLEALPIPAPLDVKTFDPLAGWYKKYYGRPHLMGQIDEEVSSGGTNSAPQKKRQREQQPPEKKGMNLVPSMKFEPVQRGANRHLQAGQSTGTQSSDMPAPTQLMQSVGSSGQTRSSAKWYMDLETCFGEAIMGKGPQRKRRRIRSIQLDAAAGSNITGGGITAVGSCEKVKSEAGPEEESPRKANEGAKPEPFREPPGKEGPSGQDASGEGEEVAPTESSPSNKHVIVQQEQQQPQQQDPQQLQQQPQQQQQQLAP